MDDMEEMCPMCEMEEELFEMGYVRGPMRMERDPYPVPPGQSPRAMSEGYAVRVRSYPEAPEVEPMKLTGKKRMF